MAILDDDNIIDLDLSVIRKKRFRIDGDSSRCLELNTSDLGIFARLKDIYPKMRKLAEAASTVLTIEDDVEEDSENEELASVNALAKLTDIDKELRGYLDEIFDSKVSEVCAPDGTLFDPVNGALRFEHIIEVLTGLYEDNLQNEFKAMTKRVQKHTNKYTKKK